MTPGDQAMPEKPMQRVYIDLTHLGRHVTGIERVSIEQFEQVRFKGADVRHVRARGVPMMILKQQLILPLLAFLNPRAIFVFPGFPPSPVFRFCRERAVLYVHDAFLVTRPQDLSLKARIYMAPPFRSALARLRYFLTNSEKTRREIEQFLAASAVVTLYRPHVRNVFGLDATGRSAMPEPGPSRPLRLVSVGTVEPRKNYPAAAAILDALRRSGHPDAHLHIIGRQGWGEDADALSAHPGVTVHGYLPVDKVKQILEGADVYVCTSHDEGLGLPLLEAQFAGLPVVAPDGEVFREVLGTSGWLVDPSNPERAAATILEHIGKPHWRMSSADLACRNIDRWNCLATQDLDVMRGMFAAPLNASFSNAGPQPVRVP